MSSTPEFNAEQLAAARATKWHQSGEPLLTLDSVREWVITSGIVLFAPRSLQLPAPAPSLVEAMIGSPSGGPTDAQLATARGLVARLVSEGNALPLNLLGTLGETPDFIVSAQVFSFLYTLRGDKAWKQAPSTTGATKSSPLGVRIFEVLTEKGALTAAELATEMGRELTENAVQRALTELWSNLRVIPLLSQSGGPAMWELTSRRFTKAIKAGINAGQPTALSALISLYMAQALLATIEEIEIFLSPLAARSRIREVVNALTNSRQIETVVLEGKSLLHIPGTLPEFPAIEVPEPTEEEAAAAAAEAGEVEGEGRIKRFAAKDGQKTLGDYKGKPAKSFAAGGTRPTPRTGAERRPFSRDAAAKPSFTKPWDEDRKPRTEGAEGEAPAKRAYKPRESGGAKKPYTTRDGATAFAKKPYAPREGGGGFAKKPYTPREGGSGFAKKPYTPREGSGGFEKKPYTPREGGSGFAKKPYTPREGGSGFAKKPYTPREGGGGFEKKPYTPREGGSGFAKRPYTPREGGSSERPSYGAKRSFGDKPAFRKAAGEGYGSKPRFTPKDSGDRKPYARKSFGDREEGSSTPPAFRKFDAPKRPYAPRGGRPDKPAYGGSNSKPRAPREDSYAGPTGTPKRPFPRKEGDLADRPVRPWPAAKPGRADGRPGGPGSSRPPRKDFGDRPARPSFGDRPARPSFGSKPSFGSRPSSGSRSSFGSKPGGKSGGFSKRSTAGDTTSHVDSKPFVRRGVPGQKPSFPRKPRTEE